MEAPNNIIKKSDISKDWMICSEQRSADCLKVGDYDKICFKGRVCKKCYAEVKAEYYQNNKKAINDKIVAKRRIKKKAAELAKV